jgi:predicted flap endonuclease-1-like 5' DNA nuclease
VALLRGGGPQLQRLTAEGEVSRLQAELAENRQKLATTEHELKTAQARLKEAEQTLEQLRAELNLPVQPAAEPAKNERKDRLERIRGIGAVFARRLNEVGISTFEQLAELSPDRIREIVHVEEWQKIEPEKWIEEARELGGAEERRSRGEKSKIE